MELAMRALTLLIAAAGLAACAGSAGADGKLTVTPAVWSVYQQHLSALTSTGFGYFAVSKDGRTGAGWGCAASKCKPGPSSKAKAVDACEQRSGGSPCEIFAEGHDIVVPYEVGP